MSKADPKHGRWILPLVIAGLVLFTYLFVNALPPGPSGADGTDGTDGTGAEGTTAAPGDGDSTTSTTGVDPETAAFLDAVDDFTTRSAGLVEEAETLNADYDAEEAEFAATRDGLADLQERTDALAAEIGDFDVPPAASDAWAGAVSAGGDMATAAAEMLDGLVNTSGSEKRHAELGNFQTAAGELASALEAAAGSL